MKKTIHVYGVALLGAMLPLYAGAQTIGGDSVFSDGGGLLLEPADPLVQQPGVLNIPATGGAGGQATDQAATGSRGGPADGQRNPLFTIGVSTGFTYEDSEDEETDAYFGSRFNFGVLTATRTQTFEFNVGGESRLSENETETFINPSAILNYELQNRSTLFSTDLIWREADVEQGFLDPDFDASDLNVDDGTRSTHEARLRLVTGRDARFGSDTRLEFREVDFQDVTDPDLVPETRYTASTELRFSVDRRTELTVFGRWTERSEDDVLQTVETNTSLGVRANVLLDQAWTGQFEAAFLAEDTETTAGLVEEDGFDLSAEVTRFLPNGQLAFAASYRDLEGDTQTELSVSRALELANGTTLSGSFGVVSFDGGDLQPLVGLRYSREVLRGHVLAVSLEQRPGEDDDDNDVVRTLFNVSYDQLLTRNSRIGLTAALAGVDQQLGDDTLAASIGISYAHDLTEDWSLVARADSQLTFEDGDRTDRTNRFSINLERTFSFRP